jgi:Domain of unknown function (DUF4442)
VGSQHAAALFGAGEAASGAAVVGAFADHLGAGTSLARSADIRYLRVARGLIIGTARLGDSAKQVLGRMADAGRVEFPVAVEMTNAERTKVAEMTVHWVVRRNTLNGGDRARCLYSRPPSGDVSTPRYE